jgi:Cof subfamily protein (haloacid dehalogenase superfamily)
MNTNKILDPNKIKALAIDLDGTTLLPNATMGERTRECLKNLISKGMQIIIATGRAVESSESYRSAIGAEGPMVFFNGAEIVDSPSGGVIQASMIGLDVVDYGLEIAHSMGIHYQVYLPAGISPDTGEKDTKQPWGALVMEKYGDEAKFYQKNTGIVPVIKDIKHIVNLPHLEGCIKALYIVDSSLHEEIRKRLDDRFGNQIEIIRSYANYLEIVKKGVSKGEGLKVAMQHRGLKPEEVVAFGDEENDLSMFPVAGFAAAPESASKKIQDAADLIFGPNTEEGLAKYLEEIFL